MVHRTYRRLDEPPKLAGFSFTQWLGLLVLGGLVFGAERLVGLPTQPAISAFTLLVGGPAALMFFSETGRPSLLRLARDLTRWLTRPRAHHPGPGPDRALEVRQPDATNPKPARRRRRRLTVRPGS
jgi:hypothetical protein